MTVLRLSRSRQAGMTLVELMVVVLLTGLVSAMMVAAYMVTARTDRATAQDHQALANLRIATDRIERELRQARRVYRDSNASRLHFWVDYDRDNQQDPSERITFIVTTNTGAAPSATGTTSTLWRRTDEPGSPQVIVTTGMQLFPATDADRLTFQYKNQAGTTAFTPVAAPSTEVTPTSLIELRLASDEAEGPYPAPRTLKTEVRLRNATTY